MKDFIFSAENPPKSYMKNIHSNIRSDRELLKDTKNIIAFVPWYISVIETYECKFSEKDPRLIYKKIENPDPDM